ncbi:hypothetical protein M8C21_032256 [Ambrosia artemisiifolia]|uniref:Chloride channel protein n=1 Tax=Ambrosia artemisiifolia TaxID=4212 RepID=A0AAD5DGF6_AMBAR|nr:hypothetical protein M8C21_032256 [Ambrosia artemisiifolia]
MSSSSSSIDGLEGKLLSERSSNVRKQLDHQRFAGRRFSVRHRLPRVNRSDYNYDTDSGNGPPEWAMLLIGCLIGVATGLCVAAFNLVVHVIHEWSWAGIPNEGAAWMRLQRLADTWHRILLIPVTGGIIVGVLHGLLEVIDQIKKSTPGLEFNLLSGIFPTVKAIQAAVTLGTGCSLGPEGPSVDIGKSCANGCLLMMENNKEQRIALVAAGAAAGISSGFNAAVAGCFFAIETVLRSLRAENSPPFTTAMIILASVISSTTSSVILGEKQAFTVPIYDLKSVAGLVGGLYAPSLMIGAAVGAVFGGSAMELIKSAIPGNFAIAEPQAYALVGMAATLASVCSVPLTSVLLLFELTKDYRILLPLMGAVGLAIWVPSIANQCNKHEGSDTRSSSRGYSVISSVDGKIDDLTQNGEDDLELCIMGPGDNHDVVDEDIILEDLKVSRAMSNNYPKVLLSSTVNEAVKCMDDNKQSCVLIADPEDHLEGILTYGDIRRSIFKISNESSETGSSTSDLSHSSVSSICIRGINYRGLKRGLITCYPDTDLAIAKKLMEARDVKQLPVVQRGVDFQEERKRRIVGILYYHSIWSCLSEEIDRRGTGRTKEHIEEKNLSSA